MLLWLFNVSHIRRWGLMLLCISVPALGGNIKSVVINDIRVGSGESKTRMVFDLSSAISYKRLGKSTSTQLVLEIPLASFQKSTKDIIANNKLIKDIRRQDKVNKGFTLLTIDLSKPVTENVFLLGPSGRYGHRLIIDFRVSKENKSISAVSADGEQASSKALFLAAQHAMSQRDYAKAESIYIRLMESTDETVKQLAYEFYAVALERSGKKARAKKAYDDYLKQYPESDGSFRVKQRLAALITLEQPTAELRSANNKPKKTSETWQSYGGFFQYYRMAENTDDNGDSKTSLSMLSTSIDSHLRYRSGQYEITSRVNGGYDAGFLGDGPGDSGRLSYFYIEAEDRENEHHIKLGRQRDNHNGVMGRFDGVQLSTPTGNKSRINIVAGYPVNSSSDTSVNSNRYFFGVGSDLGPFYGAIDVNIFAIEQRIDSYVDRRAIGTEVTYNTRRVHLSGLLDYDIFYKELNALLLNSSYIFPSGTTTNLSLNYRKSPFLTTQNALIGQQSDELDTLEQVIDDGSSIEDLALDRTYVSKTANLYVSHPLSQRYSISGSFTLSRLSDTPESGGVQGFEGTGNEYYYYLQIFGQGLFSEYDSGTISTNHSKLAYSDINTLYLNYRYRWPSAWSLQSKLSFQKRDNQDGSDQSKTTPVLRVEYRFMKRHTLDGEFGGQFIRGKNRFDQNEKYRILFFNLGYYYIF